VSATSKGMDLAPSLAVALGVPCAANVSAVRLEGGTLAVTSQLYGGKVFADVGIEGGRAVVSMVAGATKGDPAKAGGTAAVEEVTVPADAIVSRIVFRELAEPEAADVDITREDVLVSVGRGIGEQSNLEIVQELADAIGCPLSASRPIVDLGWLPKSRQVGKSGVTVKPKVYLAIGISGAPEHVQGMKDAATIVAINSDPKAPIFDFAHFGITADLFDVVPALTEKVKEAKGG
jgi:electron transfer flavoprotein alpha subunit